MGADERLRRENAALRERMSALGAAVLRVGASLDVETVLREVVDSARALTGARYGMIATVGADGGIEEFLAPGLTPEERRHMAGWPHGYAFFDHLREEDAPLRIADVSAYTRSLGYAEELRLSKTLQATPMRHRGRDVGSFFLGGKAGGRAFTAADEEVLVLFASQAAAAIANARAHREERRARADLEALVDTCPVGVVVVDAASGRPLRLNREARRIVAALGSPDEPAEGLLERLTCRRPDGREVRLRDLPLAREPKDAETVRAEEIELAVPDGRSLATLLNATPIRDDDGAVESLVVTLQDLAPLEELERQRMEFLGMVGHELRAPLTSIKGAAATLLGGFRDLERAEMRAFFRIVDAQAEHMRALIADLLDAGRMNAGRLTVSPEPADVAGLVEEARRAFLGGARHAVLVDLPAHLPPVTADRRRIVQVLNNLLANAARHSPESRPIRVAAGLDGVHVRISVTDEGSGVAPERLGQLFSRYPRGGGDRPAGAGLGLAICKGLVEAHGGRIGAESPGPGQGTRVEFTLPVAETRRAAAASEPEAPAPGDVGEPTRVLVVDDDPATLRYVRDALAGSDYAVIVTDDPEETGALVRARRPGLVLLDLMLPGADGIELMRTVPELSDLPVIFISGYGRDETVARALEAGAADYIVKPFSPTELTARIGAALRRRAAPAPFVLGALSIDYDARHVTVHGRAVRLTATEYRLLRALSLEAGRVCTYETLLRRVWGGSDQAGPERVRTYVKKLRRKLGEDAARPRYVLNARGVGYRMPRPGEPVGP